MTRKRKTTVDYFPHFCDHGKIIYILEKYWDNDGYAVFYKLFEQLGGKEGHYLDFSKNEEWEFFIAKTLVSAPYVEGILDKLAEMGVLDKELWEHRIVWVQSFVDALEDLYSRRVVELPTKPGLGDINTCSEGNPYTDNPVSEDKPDINPQGKPQSKVDKSKVKREYTESFLSFFSLYPKKEGKFEAQKSWDKLTEELQTTAIASLKKQIYDKKKKKESGEFVAEWPYPATWLNQRRWEDEIATHSAFSTPKVSSFTICPQCKREVLKADLEGVGCIKCMKSNFKIGGINAINQ